MNRLSKIMHSRYFLAALCILLEFIQMLALFTLFYKYFLPGTIISYLFYAGILLYMINHDEIPEFKLPWMIILMLFPLPGAFIYMLFTSTQQNKKLLQRFEANMQEVKSYLDGGDCIERLKEQDIDAYLQANYLRNATEMGCFIGSKATYYRIGEDFHQALLESLQKAEKFIFMEYFIIGLGQMWNAVHEILKEKAAAGVVVCLMYDDLGCMATLPEQYYEQLNMEGIKCIPCNRFTASFSRMHNNRDHRKITVIDGKIGFTGGINLADEYINAVVKHGHWKDTAVKIEGEAVKNLTALFLVVWNVQNREQIAVADYIEASIPTSEMNGVVIPYGDGPFPVYKDTIGKNVYLNMINTAKKYIYITTPYLICDHELVNALRLAAKKGVDVRIITPHIPDKKMIFLITRSSYGVLLADGVRIYEYTPGFIHAKNFVCDDKFAVCGTINLDYRSLVHHFECGAWMYDAGCTQDMKADFLETSQHSEMITLENSQMKGWKKLLGEVMKVFSPLL